MALGAQSLFLYGYTVSAANCNVDFVVASGGSVLTATLDFGEYSLTSLLTELANEMGDMDPQNTYSWTADRTILGGTQNRVEVETSGGYLKLLFGSGPNATTSVASLIGFNGTDYSGHTSYIGSQTTGTVLIPTYIGYNYLDVNNQAKVFGARNISASGLKETVTFNTQQFIDVDFKYEPKANLLAWVDLFNWLMQQNPFDFTPEITNPTTFYQVTLEKTQYDGQGMGFRMSEMLPNFPNTYQTGPLNFRIVLDYNTTQFVT